MKTLNLRNLTLSVFALFVCVSAAMAQGPGKTTARPQRIAEADKQALIAIFKDVDPSKYRLQFGNNQVIGTKPITMGDLTVVNRSVSPVAAGVKWTLVVGDRSENEVFYVYTEGESELVSTIGRAKVNQLKAIAAKYVQ